MNLKIKKLENWIDNYLLIQREKYKDITDVQYKIDHIIRTSDLASNIDKSNELLRVAMKYHDIGRFMQYNLIGCFDDKIVSHHDLGISFIEQQIDSKELEDCEEIELIKKVIKYHGIKNEKSENIELIKLSTIIDALDNSCCGIFYYIEDEIKKDSKNYKKNNPELDMKKVSNEVLNFYLKSQYFDKLTYCNTYADYLLFAAELSIQSLKSEYKELAKSLMSRKINDFENVLEGFKYLFKIYINEELSELCYKILEEEYKKI